MITFRLVRQRPDWDQVLYAGENGAVVAVQLSPLRKWGNRVCLWEYQWWQMPQRRDPRTGYWKVSVRCQDATYQHPAVHQLVCETWHQKPPGKNKALHQYNNKDNNRERNLRWGNDDDQKADGRTDIAGFLKSRQLVLQVWSNDSGLDGTITRDGRVLELPRLPKLSTHAGTKHSISGVVNDLLYRYQLHEQGIVDFKRHFPEKICRIAPAEICPGPCDNFPIEIQSPIFEPLEELGTSEIGRLNFYNAIRLLMVEWYDPEPRPEIGKPENTRMGPPTLLNLLKVAGTVNGLPPDMAEQHDHYIHGTPRR